ncbi:hypothetical protein DPMN_179796 [Dreissena polymorpha]|uniref:Uncharacterized protein n=1 Tax=Dreissena polymorpha TaxID=45954 RepID=A0A9D4IJW3_DREPO|nr:hypothetical protein DPMN_179796 [Dreissena polymorpha]
MRESFSGTIKDIAEVAGKGSVEKGTKIPGDCWINKVLGFDGVAAARGIILCNVEETRGAENTAEVAKIEADTRGRVSIDSSEKDRLRDLGVRERLIEEGLCPLSLRCRDTVRRRWE